MKIMQLTISGYPDMVRSVFISNKKYNQEIEEKIQFGENARLAGIACKHRNNNYYDYKYIENDPDIDSDLVWYRNMIAKCFKLATGNLSEKTNNGPVRPDQIQQCHSTVTRFLDFSCTVEGLHRGATDDFDAHAKRLDSRIIRRSTRTTSPNDIELSDWYKGKIIPFGDLDDVTVSTVKSITETEDVMIRLPATIIYNNTVYRKSRFGYVADEFKDNYDVLRGLTPLGMSNLFTFKCNMTEWAHIVKLRRPGTHASPELQEMIKMINDKIVEIEPLLNDDFWNYCIQ